MEKTRRKLGFTIVELLTVMAIIAILMGLLLPAMQAVRKLAKDVSQKAQFKTIETALEAFNSENGTYPESSVSPSTEKTVGAHKLAEALVGRDLQGYDPKSSWDVYVDEPNKQIYANPELPQQSQGWMITASEKRRQDLYLAADKVEAFQLKQLFNSTTTTNSRTIYPGNLDNTGNKDTARVSAPVLTDVYRAKKVTLPNGTTLVAGTPILYYKADISSKTFPDTMNTTSDKNDDFTYSNITNVPDYIYDVNDNDDLINLNQMMKPTSPHHFNLAYTEDIGGTTQNGLWIFYNTITNPKMTQPRPYNMNSYILISAGNDGVYGTKDDIYNFEK
jgi:prepilin-type N-terminal cleavage/methylation domain-containing protein